MNRLAVVVGHNSERQGAVRVDNAESEYQFNSHIANLMAAYAEHYGLDVRVFHRVASGGYRAEIRRVYDAVDEWGANASIELHFNAASSPNASGTETLSSGTVASMRLAEAVQRHTVATLGLRDRGIKTRAADERGGGSLHSGIAPAILVEPFFGSSPADVSKFAAPDSGSAELASAIMRGAAEALNAMPRTDLSGSRTLQATQQQRAANRVSATTQIAAGVATAATAAREQIEAVPAVGALSDWLPYVTIGLVLVAFVATAMSNRRTDDIDEARLDDHERGLR